MNKMNGNENGKNKIINVIASSAQVRTSSDLRICSSPCKQGDRGDRIYSNPCTCFKFKNNLSGRSLEKIFKKIFRDDSSFSTPAALLPILTLAAVLSTGMISESRAETWDCGKIANTVSCTLDDDGVFTVSGKGEMDDYEYGVNENGQQPASSAPWGNGIRTEMRKIKSIVIEDGVTRVGENAFCGADQALSVSMNNVVSIGKRGFYDLYSLQEAYMPNVETIEASAFGYNGALKTIYAPKAKQIRGSAFFYTKTLEYAEINNNASIAESTFDVSNLSNCKGGICANCGNKYILHGKGCVNQCPESFKINDGWCDRIRYTPAEAAAVLHDDNTNSVTITFKK